jgi:hypothetical protein
MPSWKSIRADQERKPHQDAKCIGRMWNLEGICHYDGDKGCVKDEE